MPAPTRPKLTPAAARDLRRFLRSSIIGLSPRAADAIIRSSPSLMLERLNANPLRLWDAAWFVDGWAVGQRRRGLDDGGAYDLAGVMYDAAAAADAAAVLNGPKPWRWRDVHDRPQPLGPHRPWRRLTREHSCGCESCQWEQPHPKGDTTRPDAHGTQPNLTQGEQPCPTRPHTSESPTT